MGIWGPLQNRISKSPAEAFAGELVQCYDEYGEQGARSFINHFRLELYSKRSSTKVMLQREVLREDTGLRRGNSAVMRGQ